MNAERPDPVKAEATAKALELDQKARQLSDMAGRRVSLELRLRKRERAQR